ncbi:DNA polymerase III subunit alpha [Brumimicrobium aurantiacum]|uniref:DNA polymerase III subunit alpha n=1 Tax=Brumimicrobium aurantiacum TaxID=1737063 RepID=A0A3E1EUH1_9FLAO|nr:DNA polymerase III subunit alpha [Brumimicrobium aurantiacum]RFC53178.1 DNA polymerase III subunit alpha [Brumimicrobium aurantiacum]
MFIHTKYSIGYGMKSPEKIIQWAKNHEFPCLAITDINTTTAILSSLKYAQEIDFPIVAGVDIRNGMQHCYLIIAQNNRGFHEMNAFLTAHLHENINFPKVAPYFANCKVIYPLGQKPKYLREHEFIGIQAHEINKVPFIKDVAKEKLLAAPIMTFQSKREFNTHRLLRAINENTLLSQLSKSEQAPETEWFYNLKELNAKFEPANFVITQTFELLAQCKIDFGFNDNSEPQNIQTYTGTHEEDKALIQSLCLKGRAKRYPWADFSTENKTAKEITERIDREIKVIEQKGYMAYFLVTWDIIHYAKSQTYFHVGRGSGANSIVAYLLGITDVDPLELDLYFERFINLHRKNPPDFDIDFSWRERDDVLKYIFNRFPNTALICTYNTFKYRSCVRELGKVLGLPKSEIDKLAKGKFQLHELDHMSQLVLKYGKYIEGLPSHLSIHAGGVIISEKPTSWLSATFLPPKGFPTVQFSMLEAEDVGLYKFDILSQRGLSKIRESLDVIAYNQPEAKIHDIHDLVFFKQDKKIQKMLQNGEAMGCFYVESPAMRMLMKKLKTTTYLDLVAASSIIRPGVSSSGMMKEYILRHKDKARRKLGHPLLLSIMPETYGIMVYQEDVIKVAHHFAGLTLDEADILRRGMSGKYRSRGEFTAIRDQFFSNCKAKGYADELTQTIWEQIESFAGYAFSKGHSASYAVESFQSLYLKAYFPLEYMVATINNFGGYYSTEFYIHEARRLGANIEPPCIQNSKWETVIKGKTIYLGFQLILGIDSKEIIRLLRFRAENGNFNSLDHYLRMLHPTLENLLLLIRIGAFRTLSTNKQALKWQAHLFYKKAKVVKHQALLFQQETKQYQLPQLQTEKLEQTFEELDLLGFPLGQPFDLLEKPIQNFIPVKDFSKYDGQHIIVYGYLVAIKPTRTKKGEIMNFGTFQDCEGHVFDTVHFPPSVKSYPFRGKGIYKIQGKVTQDFGYFSLEVNKQVKLKEVDDQRF